MITTIGFDADDTLWHNETIFEATHRRYEKLLSAYHDESVVKEKLFATEMRNLKLYGYGIKGFTLSAIETAINLTEGQISADEIQQIIGFAREMLQHPVELLDGVTETLGSLQNSYATILLTKGDLRDQQRKLSASGLLRFFRHWDVVSEKDSASYRRILDRYAIDPASFLMVGNSLKSDILPAIEIGATAVHIPYHLTWQHEHAETPAGASGRFFELENIRQLPELLTRIGNSG